MTHPLKYLRDHYEYWSLSYLQTNNMNHLVRAQAFLKLYMEAVNNSPVSQKELGPSEEMRSTFLRLGPTDNKARIYNYLKKANTWKSLKDLQDSLNLSQHCVRTSLKCLLSEKLVTKRQIRKHSFKRNEYKIKSSN